MLNSWNIRRMDRRNVSLERVPQIRLAIPSLRSVSTEAVHMKLLELQNISKNFGAIKALTDVSFSMEKGEVLGLMGDNGAGKSTLVKIISGNFPPSSGELLVEGEAVHFTKPVQAREKGIEVVYQDLALCNN